mgnify:CR=1 FL=1
MHVLYDLWTRIDEFGMILVWNMNGWLVMNVDMELVCIMTLCWLEKHDVGVVRT